MDTSSSSSHHRHQQSLLSFQSDKKLSSYNSPGGDSGFGSAEHGSQSDVMVPQEFQDSDCRVHESQNFDREGGSLFLPGCNVCLHIPPGALTEKISIRLGIMEPSEVGCSESSKVPRITPILQCGPDGLEFLLPVKLVVPHCGQIQDCDGAHGVEVYTRSRCHEGKNPTWKRDDEASASAVLEETTITIDIKHFSDIDVFVRDGNAVIGKLLRAWPMVYKLNEPDEDVILMLWMCNNEEGVYKQILQEQISDGKIFLNGSYLQYVLQPSRQSVSVKYQNQSAHYLVDGEEEIGYAELWYGNRGTATITLTKNGNNVGLGKLQGTLMAQQGGNRELKFVLKQMVSDFFRSQGGDIICEDADGQSPTQNTTFEIPYILGKRLSNCLDRSDTICPNWKSLAHELGYSGTEIDNIEHYNTYPTHRMLSAACKSGKLRGTKQLKSILTKLERIDAVNIIKNYETKKATDPIRERLTEVCQAAESMDTSEISSSSYFSESENRDFSNNECPVAHSTPTRSNSFLSTKSSEQDSEDSGFVSPGSDCPDKFSAFSQ